MLIVAGLSLAALTDSEIGTFELASPIVRVPSPKAATVAEPTPVQPSAPTAVPVPIGTLAVRVTADGAPVANAEVSLTDGSRPTLATATTDREGLAQFKQLAPGPYELWARSDAKVSKLARIADLATSHEVALALEPAGTLRGRLEGVPAATITLSPLDVDHVDRTVTVDATGRFAIAGVPHGRWRIESAAVGYVQDGDQIVDVKGDRDDVAVRMLRAGAASGSVVDGNGAPVAHATIVLRKQGLADERATATASVAGIAPRLRWVHPLAGRRIIPHTEFLRFGASRSGTRPAECGRGHCGVDIGWERGTVIHAAADGEIALAFTDIHGEAGRSIAIEHGDGVRTYYMHLDELRPNLQIGHKVRAGDALGTMGATGAASGPHLHFALTQERGGRTWYLDPEPILRHAVVLPQARTLEPLGPVDRRDATMIGTMTANRREAPALATTIVTDSRGRFRVDHVTPGSYVAVAFAAELAPNASSPFTVRTGNETADIAIALRPGVLVTGRVLGRDGPVAGARIVAGAGSGESAQQVATTTTTSRGEFTLRALNGTITLAVSAPGHGVAERTITLGERGARREDFSLVVEDAQLRGQVLAAEGGPAANVAVRIVEGPTRRSTITDAAGRFTIDRAASGTYVLEVSSVDHPPTRVTAEADRWTEIRIARGGGIRIDLRDHASAPVAGIDIEATGPADRKATTVTDPRGIATLRGLQPGEWTVRVRAKGYTQARRTFTIRAGAPDDMRIELARSVTLAGVVRDRQGRRVANARVVAGEVSTQTDDAGNFRLVDAPAGSYVLEAELDGARGAVQVELSAGAERLTLEIELQ